jgi:hypothetical protein
MLITIQMQIKRDNQKLILRTTSRFDEFFPVFPGLKRKMVNFSLKLLPALERTRKEKKSIRSGSRKSMKIMLYLYYLLYMMSTHSFAVMLNFLPFQSV